MAYTEAQKKATIKYMKNAYDRIEIKVPKGKKVTIQNHADKTNESTTKFINRAIDEAMERDNSAASE